MNKTEAMNEIETIRARLTVLEGIVQEPEQKGFWRPKMGERYWSVCINGETMSFIASQDICLADHIEQGNCFPTREAAEKAAPLFARAHKIIQAALMCDDDAGAQDNKSGRVWSVQHGNDDGFTAYRDWGTTVITGPAHVHTKAQAERMAEILNAEGVK